MVVCIFQGICLFNLNCGMYWHEIIHNTPFFFLFYSNVLSFLVLVVLSALFFFSWSFWLEVYQFHLIFSKRLGFCFIHFSPLFCFSMISAIFRISSFLCILGWTCSSFLVSSGNLDLLDLFQFKCSTLWISAYDCFKYIPPLPLGFI